MEAEYPDYGREIRLNTRRPTLSNLRRAGSCPAMNPRDPVQPKSRARSRNSIRSHSSRQPRSSHRSSMWPQPPPIDRIKTVPLLSAGAREAPFGLSPTSSGSCAMKFEYPIYAWRCPNRGVCLFNQIGLPGKRTHQQSRNCAVRKAPSSTS